MCYPAQQGTTSDTGFEQLLGQDTTVLPSTPKRMRGDNTGVGNGKHSIVVVVWVMVVVVVVVRVMVVVVVVVRVMVMVVLVVRVMVVVVKVMVVESIVLAVIVCVIVCNYSVIISLNPKIPYIHI